MSEDVNGIRRAINLVSGGERGLYYRLTGRQNLRFFSDLYRVPIAEREGRVERLLELVGLENAVDKRVEDYSRGMKQRLHIARGLINDPEILFLDEPTIGLDPEIARDIRALVRRLADGGMTIVLTTHDMREADELCDRIGLISEGRIVSMGTPEELKSRVRRLCIVEIEVDAGSADGLEERLMAMEGVLNVSSRTGTMASRYRLQVDDRREFMSTAPAALGDLDLLRISVEETTLEDAYLALVRADDQS